MPDPVGGRVDGGQQQGAAGSQHPVQFRQQLPAGVQVMVDQGHDTEVEGVVRQEGEGLLQVVLVQADGGVVTGALPGVVQQGRAALDPDHLGRAPRPQLRDVVPGPAADVQHAQAPDVPGQREHGGPVGVGVVGAVGRVAGEVVGEGALVGGGVTHPGMLARPYGEDNGLRQRAS